MCFVGVPPGGAVHPRRGPGDDWWRWCLSTGRRRTRRAGPCRSYVGSVEIHAQQMPPRPARREEEGDGRFHSPQHVGLQRAAGCRMCSGSHTRGGWATGVGQTGLTQPLSSPPLAHSISHSGDSAVQQPSSPTAQQSSSSAGGGVRLLRRRRPITNYDSGQRGSLSGLNCSPLHHHRSQI